MRDVMKSHPVAFVLGNSLLMDSVASSLVNCLRVSVVRLDASGEGMEGWIKAFQPKIVVLELNTSYSSNIPSLLSEQPEILLLGMDTNSSQVVVFSGSRHQIEDMDQFCQLVTSRLLVKTRIRKGGSKQEKMNRPHLPEPA